MTGAQGAMPPGSVVTGTYIEKHLKMKYSIKGIGLMTASAIMLAMLASCRMETFREELLQEDGGHRVEVRFRADEPGTRTSFTGQEGNEYPVLWTTNDESISVSMSYGDASLAGVVPSEDGRSATFTAMFPYSSAPCRFLALSPGAASLGPSPSRLAWAVNIPEEQTPLESSCDEAAQVLAAISEEYPSTPTDVKLHFKHAVAYIRLNLNDIGTAYANAGVSGAAVQSIDLSFGTPVAGSWYYYLQGSDSHYAGEMAPKEASSTISLNTASLTDRWLALAPVTLTGKSLRVTVRTDKGDFMRTVTLSDEKVLAAGEIYTLNISMKTAEPVAPDEVYTLVSSTSELAGGDEVIIVDNPSGSYAMSTTHSGGSNIGSTSVTVKDGAVANPSESVERFTVEESGSAFNFKMGSKYLAAEKYTSTYWTTYYYVTEASEATAWDVSISSGNAEISYTAGSTTYDIRYYSGFRMSTSSSYSPYTVAIFKKDASSSTMIDDPILSERVYGAYLATGDELYISGPDQLSVE